tara:strand:- start:1150 stop:1563 length:414 start_codon:yes stop_codon:yes gene_type:complete
MIQILSLDADVYWGEASVKIKDAIDLSNGRHTLETTLEKIKSGQMKLWGVVYGDILLSVFVTQRTLYPNKQVLSILFCGGKSVIRYIKKIESFFKNEAVVSGCKGVEIIGRKGWAKVIKKNKNLKFEDKGIFYEMDT